MTGFTHKLTLFLVVATFSSLAVTQAQDAHPLPRHPGDVIKYEIKFDGPNADKITRLNANLSLRVQVQKDQAGFASGINGSTNAPVSPKTFDLQMKVPDDAATGDYYLSFDAYAAEGYGNYRDGQEFNIPPVHVDNPKKFAPPSVTVTPLP